jgi:hypothetical protein
MSALVDPPGDDYLMHMTRQGLLVVEKTALRQGVIEGSLLFDRGHGCNRIPLSFDRFLALSRTAHNPMVSHMMATSLGPAFFMLAVTMSEIVGQVDLIDAERGRWMTTVLGLLRDIRPHFIIDVREEPPGAIVAPPQELAGSILIATGTHPAKVVALAVEVLTASGVVCGFGPTRTLDKQVAWRRSEGLWRAVYAPVPQ